MKSFQASDIRNFALVGHGASGKTILSEAMLACSGRIGRIGSIENGTTTSDYHEDEKARKISIHASLLNTEWMGTKFNMIDTPGYLDFISDGLGALRVGDFAMVVVGAAQGVEPGTRQVWDYATRFGIPKVLVLNQCDKENWDFEAVLADIRKAFGPRVFPMNLPIDPGPGFSQVLDVLRSEEVVYAPDSSGRYQERKAPGEWDERVRALHRELIEYIAESDDTLLERFFENDGLSEEELRSGVHRAVQLESFIPLFTVSGGANIGVARLMDFVAKFGSSPVDRRRVDAVETGGGSIQVKLDDPDPVCYVFKTISEAHVGDLSFFRVYAGSVESGMELYNASRQLNERFGQIFTLNGRERQNLERLNAGDIGAVVKLRDTHTGNTLCGGSRRVFLPKTDYPNPNIHGALLVKNRGDEERLSSGLATLHEEDPTFLYRVDPEVGQTIISGQGDLHLQVMVDALRNRFNAEVELIEPRVPYRETIRGRGDSRYRHKKQSGGAGQFAEVWMRIEPLDRDAGVEFTESLVGQNVDRVFVPSVEKGVRSACEEGVLAGYRVVDLKVEFYDGKMHPVDSKDVAFQIAGKAAFTEAFRAARPCLLEPIMNVGIQVPEQYMGDVMGDISSRRGRIMGMDAQGGMQIIKAQIPQKELYRYSTVLRSLSHGQGTHSEELSHYEQMPPELEKRVIEAHEGGGHNNCR